MASIPPTFTSSSSSISSMSQRPISPAQGHQSNNITPENSSVNFVSILRQTAFGRRSPVAAANQSAIRPTWVSSSSSSSTSLSLSSSSISSISEKSRGRKRKTFDNPEQYTSPTISSNMTRSYGIDDCKQSFSSSSSSSTSLTSVENEPKLKRLSTATSTKPLESKPNKSVIDSINETCPVCLNDIDATKEPISRLTCKHTFHLTCLEPWIQKDHNTCPICRGDIKKANSIAQSHINSSSSMNNSSIQVNRIFNSRGTLRNIEPADNISMLFSGNGMTTIINGANGATLNQSIMYENTNSSSATNNGTYDEGGYRIYRDGSCERIDDESMGSVRLINYTASQVTLNMGNVIIEGTSHVNIVTVNMGKITIKGSAYATEAHANMGNITLSGSAHVETARANMGRVILEDHSAVDHLYGSLDDRRISHAAPVTNNQSSSSQAVASRVQAITNRELLQIVERHTNLIATLAESIDHLPNQSSEEVIGGFCSMMIGLYTAHSQSVRVKSGTNISMLVFPDSVGHGTVIVEAGASVGTIVNGDLRL